VAQEIRQAKATARLEGLNVGLWEVVPALGRRTLRGVMVAGHRHRRRLTEAGRAVWTRRLLREGQPRPPTHHGRLQTSVAETATALAGALVPTPTQRHRWTSMEAARKCPSLRGASIVMVDRTLRLPTGAACLSATP